MELDITADMTALCRVCMIAKAEGLTNLHEASSCGQPSLNEMLVAICAPVFAKSDLDDIVPDLPTKVCPPCRNAIVAAYNLHQQCIETDRRLGELLALKWELQGPGGEEVFENIEDLNHAITEESAHELLNADIQNEKKQGKVHDMGVTEHSSRTEGLIQEKAINDVSNQHEPQNTNVTNKCDNQKENPPKDSNTKDKISCSACDKLFSSRLTLNSHLSHYCDGTNDPIKRTCDICKRVMKSVRLLELHRQMHDTSSIAQPSSAPDLDADKHPADVQVHPQNNQKLETLKDGVLESTEEHQNESTLLDEITAFSCPFCDQKFDRAFKMRRHMSSHKEFLTCSNCNRTFKNRPSLQVHLKRKCCQTKPVDLQCENCETAFTSRMSWKNHIDEGLCRQTAYPCTMCEKVFDKRTRLTYHMNSHLESLVCRLCDKTFKAKSSLLIHITLKRCMMLRTVSQGQGIQKKPQKAVDKFSCPKCPKTFLKKSGLHYHMNHHKERILCPKCGQKFTTTSAMRLHINLKRCPMLKPQVQEDLQCKECNMTFSSKRTFNSHIEEKNCHQTTRAFPCNICGKTFDRRSRLSYHTACHKNRVVCKWCHKSFSTRFVMMMHVKKCPAMNTGSLQDNDTTGTENEHLPKERNPDDELTNGTFFEADLDDGMMIKIEEAVIEDSPMSAGETEVKMEKEQLADHTTLNVDRECKTCLKTFENPIDLKLHERQNHKFFVCRRCDEAFETGHELDSHKQEKHVLAPVQCTRCKEWCRSQSELQKHHGDLKCCEVLDQTPDTFTCDVCEQSFESAEVLNTHKRTHRKRTICKECGKTLPSISSLHEHLAYRCLGVKARTCELCNITFDTVVWYKKHRQETHPGPIDCPKCGRTLANLAAYRVHVKLNRCKNIIGEKPQ